MPKNRTPLMPREWQNRIRTLPSLKDRALLAVFVINAYKLRKTISRTPHNLSSWKTDQHLGHLAFWPTHARNALFKLHTHFIYTDQAYRDMASSSARKANECTFCPDPNVNTQPTTIGAKP